MSKIKKILQKFVTVSFFGVAIFVILNVGFGVNGFLFATASASCSTHLSHNGSSSVIMTANVSTDGADYTCLFGTSTVTGSVGGGRTNTTFDSLTDGDLAACTVQDSDGSQCQSSTTVANSYEGVCGTAEGTTVTTAPASTSELCYAAQTQSSSASMSDIYANEVFVGVDWAWGCSGSLDSSGFRIFTSCQAKILATCGSNAKIFAYNADSFEWSNGNLCASGKADSSPVRPSPGESVSWKCLGSDVTMKIDCTASTADIPTGGSVCGTADGVPVTTAPTNHLCYPSDSDMSDFSGSGPWIWKCTGTNGDPSVNCSADLKPVCGSSAKTYAYDATEPIDWLANACSNGTLGISGMPNFPDKGMHAYWSCVGSGGTVAGCSAIRDMGTKTDGVCGTAKDVSSATPPATADRCANGDQHYTSVSESGGLWAWQCVGYYGGTTANCSAPVNGEGRVSGVCGTDHNTVTSYKHYYGRPTNAFGGMCSVGSLLSTNGNNPYVWQCDGLRGGEITYCFSVDPDEFYIPVTSAPSGTYYSNQSVSLSTPNHNPLARIFYTTDGSNPDPEVYFYYTKNNGDSNNDDFLQSSSYPRHATYLYSPGAPITVSENMTIKAIIVLPALSGIGETVKTSAIMQADYVISHGLADGVCGSANGTATLTAPTFNLCSAGMQTAPTGVGPWSWACTGFNGGVTATCSTKSLGSSSDNALSEYHKKYLFYRGTYRNEISKNAYQEVQKLRIINPELAAKWKDIFVSHKYDSKSELAALDSKTSAVYWKYKNYNGYRNFKIYKIKNMIQS